MKRTQEELKARMLGRIGLVVFIAVAIGTINSPPTNFMQGVGSGIIGLGGAMFYAFQDGIEFI